jgi:hypothetical protein
MKKIVILACIAFTIVLYSTAFAVQVRLTLESYPPATLPIPDINDQMEISKQAVDFALSSEGWNLANIAIPGVRGYKPVGNAGPDQVVLDSDEVTLDGSQSYGTIVFYEWILHHRETSTDRFADGVKPVVSDLEPGFYEVKLTVTDGELTDTDTMLLAVGPCAY